MGTTGIKISRLINIVSSYGFVYLASKVSRRYEK